MMENNEKEIERNEIISVNYTEPKFWHRVMANFVDFFLFVVLLFISFIAVRSIVLNVPYYKNTDQKINDIQLASGLYVKDQVDSNKTVDIVYFLDKYVALYGSEFDGVNKEDPNEPPTGKIGKIVAAVNKFIEYCSNESVTSNDRYKELVSYYDSMRLDAVTSDGIHYFVKDGDNIIPNETLASVAEKRQLYYKNVYVPIVEKRCLPFLTSNVAEYRACYRTQFNFLVFLELPVALVVAAILVYFVPPLFFRRGRRTLGKALYRIGLVDDRILSPTFWRFTARFLIFLFSELLLSLFTLGIPYIISFSIMAFSKKKQGFPDYMLHLYEVDTSKANIYMDYVEAQLKNELHGDAIDFQMEKPL